MYFALLISVMYGALMCHYNICPLYIDKQNAYLFCS